MMAGVRSTKKVSLERVGVVIDLIIRGLPRRKILLFIRKNHKDWKVCDGQIDKYIQSANKELKKSANIKRKEKIGTAFETLKLLLSSNLQIQDYKAALAVQREINDLFGLKAPERRIIKKKTEKKINFVPIDEDERKLLERLYETRQEVLSEGISEDESYDVSSGGNGG